MPDGARGLPKGNRLDVGVEFRLLVLVGRSDACHGKHALAALQKEHRVRLRQGVEPRCPARGLHRVHEGRGGERTASPANADQCNVQPRCPWLNWSIPMRTRGAQRRHRDWLLAPGALDDDCVLHG
eukprot:5460940-Alexandrium_andersonii.AAC.1